MLLVGVLATDNDDANDNDDYSDAGDRIDEPETKLWALRRWKF